MLAQNFKNLSGKGRLIGIYENGYFHWTIEDGAWTEKFQIVIMDSQKR